MENISQLLEISQFIVVFIAQHPADVSRITFQPFIPEFSTLLTDQSTTIVSFCPSSFDSVRSIIACSAGLFGLLLIPASCSSTSSCSSRSRLSDAPRLQVSSLALYLRTGKWTYLKTSMNMSQIILLLWWKIKLIENRNWNMIVWAWCTFNNMQKL